MRKVVWILLLLAGLAVAAVVLGRPAYRRHKEAESLGRAQAFLAQRDFRNASLSARQVLRINATNYAACQVMASLAELAGSPALLDWRRQIAEIAPTPENRLLLASTALRFQARPYPMAAEILEDLSHSATNLPGYHLVAAELALKLNRRAEAEGHFETLARLEPTNLLHGLNLAVLRLSSTNAAEAAAARTSLDRLGQHAELGAIALGWLTADSLRRTNWMEAERYSAALLAHPRCSFEDRLQNLSLLQERRPDSLKPALESLQQRAGTNLAQIASLANWMTRHALAPEVLRWLGQMPAPIRTQQPLPLAAAEAYTSVKDWRGLEVFLADQKWTELEFMRLAFLSQAALEQKQKTVADTRWRSAVLAAGDRLAALTGLWSLAENWHRQAEREDLLWRIADRFPKEKWTLGELERHYQADGNTRGLNKVYSALMASRPRDVVVRNNLAATSLLLKFNLSRAHELAQQLHAEQPDNAIVTSTYAFSLHVTGRTREGLAALEKLSADALENPAVALYYGVLLAAAGQTNRANHYLEAAQRGRLLPEEKALLDASRGI